MRDAANGSWERIALPVLQALLKAEQGDRDVYVQELRASLGEVSDREFHNTLENLLQDGYISGTPFHEGGQRYPEYLDLRLLGQGRQVLRDWPADSHFEAWMSAIDAAIATTDEPAERSRLEKLRSTALEVGQGMLTGILTNVVTQVTGLR